MAEDYKSENVTVSKMSGATPEDCEALIGKTVARVDAGKYDDCTITFADGSSVEFGVGQSYLSVEFKEKQ